MALSCAVAEPAVSDLTLLPGVGPGQDGETEQGRAGVTGTTRGGADLLGPA